MRSVCAHGISGRTVSREPILPIPPRCAVPHCLYRSVNRVTTCKISAKIDRET
ncbi:hypothetical protein BN2497_5387 [Janthinobacterium sp. CG23_2]|nr:hypothetical protein BN2497_5387 [Janthinobacterium sp. CG23_2]CUU29091.1 hypothetical protein BN3177_5387 [Janthinobacterium sp. CG23_2]